MRTTAMVMAMGLPIGLFACGDDPAPASSEDTGDTGADTTGATTMVAEDGSGSSGTPNLDDDSTTAPTPEPTVTYHAHVRSVLERHCVQCHQPGNIGPFSMTNYEEVHGLREAIALSIEEGTMPPWLADPDCQDYLGDPTLREEDIQLVRDWVAEGGPEGDPADYEPPIIPPPPELSRVDATLQLPEPYLPELRPDDYRCFLMDWPYDETVYVAGFAAVPDQLETVHHMIAFAIGPEQVAEYQGLDDAEPGPGYTCFGGPGGAINPLDPSSIGNWLGSWAPGGFAGDYPEGTGIPVEPGTKVVLQIHYNTAVDDVQPDQSAVNFKVEASVDREATMMQWASPDWVLGDMPIPAGEASVVHSFELDPTLFMDFITDVIPNNTPFQIYSAALHMHTIGVRAEERIVRSDGSDTCLLEVPRWDFNWQQDYAFAEPITFNPGDRLRLACEWNNEAGEQTVNWGDGTGDEMCLGVFYAVAQ